MIKVGEYVRTNRGIGKVLEVKTVQFEMYGQHDVVYKIDICPRMYITKTNILKHSPNIIDLIEVGDIVNNGYIYEIGSTEDGGKWVHNLNGLLLFEKDIKTILTHEQYQANCYTVERKVEE